MVHSFLYPVELERDEEGRNVVTFPDLPGAVTDGESVEQALSEAADCLEEAIAFRIKSGLPIPPPSLPGPGQHAIAPGTKNNS